MAELEDTLIYAFKDGDEDAFRKLCVLKGPFIFRFLLCLLPRLDAEDVYQETLLAAWKGRSWFDPSRKFGPWLYGIARNKANDLLERKYAEPPLEAFEERTSQSESACSRRVTQVNSSQTLDYTSVDWLERRMGPTERKIVTMRLEGRTLLEIANFLGLTPNNVKYKLNTLRRKLEPYRKEMRQ